MIPNALIVLLICSLLRAKNDWTVQERSLVSISPTAESILKEHSVYGGGLANMKMYQYDTLAYVTPWNSRGKHIAKLFAGKFTYLSPVWYTIRPTKDEKSFEVYSSDIDQTWIKEVRNPQYRASIPKIVPRFQLAECSRKQLISVIKDAQVHALIADLMLKEVIKEGYDGATLELMIPSQMLNLVLKVSDEFKKASKNVILVIPPMGESYSYADFSEELFDILYDRIDGFSLMTYDFSNSENPGYNAPIDWVEKSIRKLTKEREKRKKIFVGLNFYGNDYKIKPTVGGGPIIGSTYLKLLEKYKPTLEWHPTNMEHKFVYESNEVHHVYFPTLKSIEQRLDLSAELGCSISIWEIGQGLDYFYDLL